MKLWIKIKILWWKWVIFDSKANLRIGTMDQHTFDFISKLAGIKIAGFSKKLKK